MNVLIVGGGDKGGWQMRGIQLGRAIGARVASNLDSLHWADVVVLVKRADPAFAAQARAAGKPVVWDPLDFWAQPEQNALNEAKSRSVLRAHLANYRPELVIGATQAMATDCGGVYLPHHAWFGLEPSPAREDVTVVAYQGTQKYLGRWMRTAQDACKARGWKFVINPKRLSDADIILALRDGKHDGWMCRQWKSGVKLVNAISAGRPVISQESAAWHEIAPEGTLVSVPADLDVALDLWADHAARQRVVRRAALYGRNYSLPVIADQYKALLHLVQRGVAA